jgi:hypothetical protein
MRKMSAFVFLSYKANRNSSATQKACHPEQNVLCGVKDLCHADLRSLRQAQGRLFAAQERRLRMTDLNGIYPAPERKLKGRLK